MSDSFYLVWREDGKAPMVKHGTYSDAYQESLRLAKLHPEASFFILKPTAEMKAEIDVNVKVLL